MAVDRAVLRRDRILVLIVPVVLVVVALNQVRLATTQDLVAWKGGGFGMFATVDAPDHRVVRVVFESSDTVVPVDVTSLFDEPARGLVRAFVDFRALPSERNAQQFLAYLERATWRIDGGIATFAGWADAPASGAALAGVSDQRGDLDLRRIVAEVHAPAYDRDRRRLEPTLLAVRERVVGR